MGTVSVWRTSALDKAVENMSVEKQEGDPRVPDFALESKWRQQLKMRIDTCPNDISHWASSSQRPTSCSPNAEIPILSRTLTDSSTSLDSQQENYTAAVATAACFKVQSHHNLLAFLRLGIGMTPHTNAAVAFRE